MEQIIPEFPYYKIDTSGRVFRNRTKNLSNPVWKELIPVLCSGTGYYLVTLCHEGVRKNKRIHRLLMEAFVPNPENKKQVNHIDGVKTNNSLSNLEWATSVENTQHAVDLGLCEKAIAASRKPILQIDRDSSRVIAEHISIHEAGRTTGVAWQNISKVVRGIRSHAGGYFWEYKAA